MQNGVSSDVYEGEIQAKKNVKKEGGERKEKEEKKREIREEWKKEEKENYERFSRSGWEWSLSF